MDVRVGPLKNGGIIKAPASKSYAHRLLICAALADKPTEIICPDTSADIDATAGCLAALGAGIVRDGDKFIVSPVKINDTVCKLDCGESGSTLRFLLPVVLSLGADAEFYMSGRLPYRPLSPLYEELIKHGAILGRQGTVPLTVRGKLRSGAYTLDGGVSSQFISGLLFALPTADGDSVINITGNVESESYISMTRHVLKSYGINAVFNNNVIYINGNQKYVSPAAAVTEGDWSNAAFWLCMGALLPEGITVTGLDCSSLQGDRAILDILKEFGASVNCENGCVTVKRGRLCGVSVNASDIPDLVPAIAAAASAADGRTVITNARRLKIKESDRLKSTAGTLSLLGADIAETGDGLIINGRSMLDGGTVSSCGDHRIAMMAAVAAQVCRNPVTINNAGAVEKSYPAFWRDYAKLGGAG